MLKAYSIILYRCIYSRQPVKYNVRYWIWSESESPSTVHQHTVRSFVGCSVWYRSRIYIPRYIIIPLAKHHVPQERFSMSVPRGIRSLNTITVRDATDLVIYGIIYFANCTTHRVHVYVFMSCMFDVVNNNRGVLQLNYYFNF